MELAGPPELERDAERLRRRRRTGDLLVRQLELASWLGDPAARRAVGRPDDGESDLGAWAARLAGWSGVVVARAALAALDALLLTRAAPAGPLDLARGAVEAWLRCPCARHFWAVPARGSPEALPDPTRPWTRALEQEGLARLVERDPAALLEVVLACAAEVGGERVRAAIVATLLPLALAPAPTWRAGCELPARQDLAPAEPGETTADLASLTRAGLLAPERLWLAAYLGHAPARDALRARAWRCAPLHPTPRYDGSCRACWLARGELSPDALRPWLERALGLPEVAAAWRPGWTAALAAACQTLTGRAPAAVAPGPELPRALDEAGAAALLHGEEAVRGALRAALLPELLATCSRAMQEVHALLERVAESEVTVLITGETGTGKERVARLLHERGPRRAGPFVAINCGALPEPLLESELFGHTRGAFTDARTARPGLLVQAHGGTLLLDEIGEMPLAMQVKLLRALQERRVRPVGGQDEVPFDVRLVAATQCDLEQLVARGAFREDLFYRLDVIHLRLPPLRARGREVLLLAEELLVEVAARARRPVTRLSRAAAERLLAYPWPGNIRELRNCIEHGVALARGAELEEGDLPARVREHRQPPPREEPPPPDPAELVTMAELERLHIQRVLRATGGNKTLAARVLGLDRKTLYRKLERHGLE